MKIDAKKIIKEVKTKIKINDFPEVAEIERKTIVPAVQERIEIDAANQSIKMLSTPKTYFDLSSNTIKNINTNLISKINNGRETYVCEDNKFKIAIDKTLDMDDGVLLRDDIYSIKIIPILEHLTGSEGNIDQNIIEFNDFIETDSLKYAITENGLNTNIRIYNQREDYIYKFKILTENMYSSLNKEGTKITFVDKTTRDKIFVIGNYFMYDNKGNQSKLINLEYEGINDDEHIITIVPNKEWLNDVFRIYPVIIESQAEFDEPVLTYLSGCKNVENINGIKNRFLLGVSRNDHYSINVNIKTEQLINELLKNKLHNYKIFQELYYEDLYRYDYSQGIRVFHESNCILHDTLNSINKKIRIDITSLIQKEMDNYKSGLDIKSIRLNIVYNNYFTKTSDGWPAYDGLDDMVEVYDRLYIEADKRPFIQMQYQPDGSVTEGTPLLTYNTGKSGETEINLFESTMKHTFPLGTIESNALKLGINLFYDSRYLKEQNAENLNNNFGKGWLLNLSQRLIKNASYNKLLGSKDIVYVDGNNNRHFLHETWYYEANGERHYIQKNLVYLDNNQKLKYKNDEGRTYEVKYEVSNKDGLILYSSSSNNYIKKSDLKINKKYYMCINGNWQKIELTINNNELRIPHFYKKSSSWITLSEYPTNTNLNDHPEKTLDGLYNAVKDKNNFKDISRVPSWLQNIRDLQHKIENRFFYDPIEIVLSGSTYFYDWHELGIEYFNCPLQYENNEYFVISYEREYRLSEKGVISYFKNPIDEGRIIPIRVEEEFYIDKDILTPDYYENEEIVKINNQIIQIEDYIIDLKRQAESYSNIQKRNLESKYFNSISTYKGSIANIFYESPQESVLYNSLSSSIQTENYENDLRNMELQHKEYKDQTQNLYSKISDYKKQLSNLKETKNNLVTEQKKNTQDYIIDKSGNILGFDYYGKLIYISDSYENEIYIQYTDNRITEIYSKNQKMLFHYNNLKCLDYIIDTTGRKKEFEYEEFQLSKIKFKAEKSIKRETNFRYNNLEELIEIIDESGLSTKIGVEEEKITSIIQESITKTIDKNGLVLNLINGETTSQKISEIKIQNLRNHVEIEDKLNKTKTTYLFDFKGRLISTEELDLDSNNTIFNLINFHNENKKFDISFKDSKLFESISLPIGISKKISKAIYFTKKPRETYLLLDNLPSNKLFFIALDLSKANEQALQFNDLKLSAKITNKDNEIIMYEQDFNISYQKIIGLPITLNKTDKSLVFNIEATNEINFSNILSFELYEAWGEIYYHDDEDKVIKIEDGKYLTEYSDFIDDKPTIISSLDRYNIKRVNHQAFDTSGRIVYEEDNLQNCKETFYDEKGQIIETRIYNKECPTLAKITRFNYDEHGNKTEISGTMRDDKDEYPQKTIKYLPNSSKITSTKAPNGQVICYGYDYNTDELLEISSDATGQSNRNQMKYQYGLLTTLSHNGVIYDFKYDHKGRKTSILINNKEYISNEYIDNYREDIIDVISGSKIKTKKLNGLEVINYIDKEGNIKLSTNNEDDEIYYYYTDDKQLAQKYNLKNNNSIIIDYDNNGFIIKHEESTNTITSEINTFDENDILINKRYEMDNIKLYFDYVYDSTYDNRITSIGLSNNLTMDLKYDSLSRVTNKALVYDNHYLFEEDIEYLQYGENSLDLIKEHNISVANALMDTTSYTYDVNGNITNIINSKDNIRYSYDKLNRLIREDNFGLKQTITTKYDNGGNILLKKRYSYTLEDNLSGGELIRYSYDSQELEDRLIEFNGKYIAYDNKGTIVRYLGNNTTWNLKGQLTSFGNNTYDYNMNGIRTSKTFNNIRTEYYILGSKILREKSSNKDIIYHYALDKLIGFNYNGTEYIYIRNIQGDITHIYTKDCDLVAEYKYDAWGNHKVYGECGFEEKSNTFIGNINPFRYRGYYYDIETGLYYLNSRYYDPEVGRFISMDDIAYLDPKNINGLNLYAYCGNNPIMYYDPNGQFLITFLFASLFLSIILSCTPIGGVIIQAAISTIAYAGMVLWAVGDLIFNNGKGAWADMWRIKWNPFNSSEEAVLKSNSISFYKGVPVFRYGNKNDRTGVSFGAIGLGRGWENNEIETVRHERGHNTQLMIMGPLTYSVVIAIPSLISAATNPGDHDNKWYEKWASYLGGA